MRLFIFFPLLLLSTMFSGCSSLEDAVPTSTIQDKGEGTILIKMVSSDHGNRLSKIVAIDRITVFVHESDGTEIIHRDLTREGDQARATLTIPAGDNRTVTINSYQENMIVKTGRDSNVDVKPGQTTTVEIEPMLFIPTLLDIEVGATAAYTVKWHSVSLAGSYTLQEDDNSAFSTPEIVYTGPDTSKAFSGKEPGESYYYRVCATNTYGNSKWSGWGAANVSADGTIEIDIPWDEWDEETSESGGTVPQFTSDHSDLVVYGNVNLTNPYTYSIRTRVTGEFTNKGKATIYVTFVTVTLLDRNGTSLGYGTNNIYANVAPGGIKPFTVDVYDVSPEQVAGGRLSFETR